MKILLVFCQVILGFFRTHHYLIYYISYILHHNHHYLLHLKKYTLFCLLFFSFSLKAQQADAVLQEYIKEVNKDSIMAHLRVLASDTYEGRGVFEAGGDKAMQYLCKEFKKRNLQAFLRDSNQVNYRQPFVLQHKLFSKCTLKTARKTYKFMDHFLTYNIFEQDGEPHDLVFAGLGIIDSVQNDFKKADVAGKWVALILEDKITNIYNTNTNTWLLAKTKQAKQHGAKGVLFIQRETANYAMAKKVVQIQENKFDIVEPRPATVNEFPMLVLNEKTSAALFEVKRRYFSRYLDSVQQRKPTKSVLRISNVAITAKLNDKPFRAANIIGYLEGSDPKGEAIVVSAHFDHLGKQDNVIYNGANDNASGTSTLLEMLRILAKMYKKDIKPRKTIIFVAFTAEEKGLWGSRFYTENPLFPLSKTKFDVNIDMVGVLGWENKQKPIKIAIIEDEDPLFREQQQKLIANYQLNLKIDYSFSDKSHPDRLFFRSDHYNFAKNGIPIAFFNSMSDRNYHLPTDDIANIEPEAMQEVAKLVFATIWTEANKL